MTRGLTDTRNHAEASPERLRLLISLPAMGGASVLLWAALYFAATRLIH